MYFSTELGEAQIVEDRFDSPSTRTSNAWRTSFQVDFQLNAEGRRCMNAAADATGGIELVMFDAQEGKLTIVIGEDVDPERTIRLWWKNFRSEINRRSDPKELVGDYDATVKEAMTVSGNSSSGLVSGGWDDASDG